MSNEQTGGVFRRQSSLDSNTANEESISSKKDIMSSSSNSVTASDVTSTLDNQSSSEHSSKEELRMKRRIGLFSGVTLIVGTMIGSGIFVSPGNLLGSAQSPGLCLTLWGACGVYALLGALSYCEIGTLIPKSGGEYIYFLEAFGDMHKFFGPILAFIFAWTVVFLMKPSSLAILSLSFAKYLSKPILIALDYCEDDHLSYILSRLLASICIGLITFVNCYSVTLATRVQNVFTVAKLFAIAIIIGGGIYYLAIGYTENLEVGFEGSATSFGQIAQAFYGGIWAYDGWNNLNFVTEELQNPYRNLPLAIIIAIPLTTICYVLVNVSYLTVLTPQEIISSGAVAVDWANKVLGPASFLIPLGVVMSVFGTANGSVFTAGRISHVAGREGHVPDVLSYVQIKKRTPVVPILFNSLLGLLMIIPGDIGTLIDFFGFTACIFYCAAMVALIVMRFTKKNEPRPIKVPIIVPILAMLISAYLVIGPIVMSPQIQYFYALGFILIGLVFYVPFVYYKKIMPGMDGITICLQKFLLIAPTTGHED